MADAGMTQRPGDDRRDAHGHDLLAAEAFVDPSRFSGSMYRAAGRTPVGRTKGYTRSNGRCTEPDAVPKDLHVPALRRDARRRLCTADPLPDATEPRPMGRGPDIPPGRLCPLRESPVQVEDFRRTRGRRNSIPSVVGVIVAARLAGIHDGIGADRFGRALGRRRPAALGAWRNPGTGRYVPPSKSVPCRVPDGTDPAGIQAAPSGGRCRGSGSGP